MSGREPGIGDLITLGISLTSILAVGFGLGWLLDQLVGTFPIFAFVGLGLAIIPAAATVYRLSKKFM